MTLNTIVLKVIGKEIKSLRESKSITVKQISHKTGIKENYLRKIENGEAANLSISQFFIIAEALKTKASELQKVYRTNIMQIA